MCDLSQYDGEKKVAVDKIRKLSKELISEFKDFDEFYSDGECTNELLIRELIKGLIAEELPVKLNHFVYNDHYYGRCGDEGGKESHLISFISVEEVKDKLKEFIKNYDPLKTPCYHEFLNSINNGILIEGDIAWSNDLLDYERNLKTSEYYDEKFLFSQEEYAKLVKKRQDAKDARDHSSKAAQLKKQEEQDRILYEKLKQKFE